MIFPAKIIYLIDYSLEGFLTMKKWRSKSFWCINNLNFTDVLRFEENIAQQFRKVRVRLNRFIMY